VAQDSICLGRIGAPHGIKGWVKLISFTQPRENLLQYAKFSGQLDGRTIALKLDGSRPQGKGLVGHFTGYDTPEEARVLTHMELHVPSEVLPELDAGEFYWHQLTGLKVINQQQEFLGVIDRLLETGANDVLVVSPVRDSRGSGDSLDGSDHSIGGSIDDQERLIPWLPDQLDVKVDLDKQEVTLDWPSDYLTQD
tara:strand:- start:6578 stop:7162 length:585 start_codon:yes stop_codon:yes gene_type:complete